MELRDEIADEISGVIKAVESGYYSTTIGIDAAQEAADALMPLVRKAQAEAWSAGWDASERSGYPIDDEDSFENPYIEQNSEGNEA